MTTLGVTSRINYSGNGATTVFSFPHYVEDAGDLDVWLRGAAGVETLQTIFTHYTFSGLESVSVAARSKPHIAPNDQLAGAFNGNV